MFAVRSLNHLVFGINPLIKKVDFFFEKKDFIKKLETCYLMRLWEVFYMIPEPHLITDFTLESKIG